LKTPFNKNSARWRRLSDNTTGSSPEVCGQPADGGAGKRTASWWLRGSAARATGGSLGGVPGGVACARADERPIQKDATATTLTITTTDTPTFIGRDSNHAAATLTRPTTTLCALDRLAHLAPCRRAEESLPASAARIRVNRSSLLAPCHLEFANVVSARVDRWFKAGSPRPSPGAAGDKERSVTACALPEAVSTAATALSASLEIGLEHLPRELRQAEEAAAVAAPGPDVPDDPLRRQLFDLLTEHGGNVSAVARVLCKARVQVRRWCRRFDLDPESFRPRA